MIGTTTIGLIGTMGVGHPLLMAPLQYGSEPVSLVGLLSTIAGSVNVALWGNQIILSGSGALGLLLSIKLPLNLAPDETVSASIAYGNGTTGSATVAADGTITAPLLGTLGLLSGWQITYSLE